MDKISVIVAVYKMPEFLPRCVEGILNQTHRNLELILVVPTVQGCQRS